VIQVDGHMASGLDGGPRDGANVLVVDDYRLCRLVVREYLQRGGCTVMTAGCRDDAAQVAANAARIDAVVTDVLLPNGNGRDVIRSVRELHPDAGVLFISGHDGYHVLGPLRSDERFLRKPFSAAQLMREIEPLLSRHAPPAGAPHR
jgi:DNA-binding response OmpR family regulator